MWLIKSPAMTSIEYTSHRNRTKIVDFPKASKILSFFTTLNWINHQEIIFPVDQHQNQAWSFIVPPPSILLMSQIYACRYVAYNNYNTLKYHLKWFDYFMLTFHVPSLLLIQTSKRCFLYCYYRELSISSFESLLNSVLDSGFFWWTYSSLLF